MQPEVPNKLLGVRVFGGYVITGLLGSGGMGAVYVAEHQDVGKKIAVKVLHERMTANRDIVTRFLAEARAASALDHPNIVEFIDAAQLESGADYIALEYLDGCGLDEYLKRHGRFGIEDALRVLAQISCGLEAAHRKGIVHRDLKLANIQVAPTTLNRLRVKILDFGIAKLMDPTLARDFETKTNAVAGTPGYMAPEQARGMKDVDHRADLYALGCIAYRMLTSRMPFDGDAIGEIIYQQLSGDPPSLLGFRPDLPDGWNEVIHRCLLVDPAGRPADATEFALTLARETADGLDVVKDVAPLFFSQEWLDRTKRHLRDVPIHQQRTVPAAADPIAKEPPTPKGATATYTSVEPQTLERKTTLSSAAQSTLGEAHHPRANSWKLLLAICGVALITLAVFLASVASDSASERAPVTEAPLHDARTNAEIDFQATSKFAASTYDASVESMTEVSTPDASTPPIDAAAREKPATVRYGRVQLSIRPYAEVYMKGKKYSDAPTTITLREGSHRIRLVNRALDKAESVRVKVRRGKPVTIRRNWSP